ncbi:MAG: carbohydrate-binding family 9-like protein [Clostridium sp.]
MYTIKKVNSGELTEKVWDSITPITINNFPWDVNGYKPSVEVKVFYTDEELKVKFVATEEKIRIAEKEFNAPVWEDSCVEFFFLPMPDSDDRYFNFEINAAGVLVLQLDNIPPVRHYMNYINPNYFEIKADVTEENQSEFDNFKPWTIEYKIPFEFIKVFFKDFEAVSGKVMKGNFTKCGDKTDKPHYGSWVNIDTEEPAFHVPRCFEELIFE